MRPSSWPIHFVDTIVGRHAIQRHTVSMMCDGRSEKAWETPTLIALTCSGRRGLVWAWPSLMMSDEASLS